MFAGEEAERGWGIASAHPLATEAGREVLEAGGNAFDAAVAVSAALGVVEPYGSGLGGGGFWLLHEADGDRDVMVDGRERAPLAATRTMYQDEDGELIERASIDGPLAAGIPGLPAALVHIARDYGELPLARSLAPAIRLARDGYEIGEPYRTMARFRRDVLQRSPAAAETFLEDGEVPPAGYRLRQPELAATLERLADQGRSGFYDGPVAEKLVQGVRAAGGIWSRRDLRQYRVRERTPIRGQYRGMEIVSAAPPSSGGIALVEALNILAPYDLAAMDPAERVHLVTEAMRRAYHDRARYLGDTDYVDVPIDRLTDPDYAAGRRASIRSDRATPSADLPGVGAEQGGRDTTHFSVIGPAGNRVAATLSINWPFGSGFMPPGTGVVLNDEMDDFAAKPGEPNVYGLVQGEANAIEPGKRMLSSMSPTFLEYGDRVAVLGTPGGSRIISMVLLAALEFRAGGGPMAMAERPRFHHQYLPDVIESEPGAFDDSLRAALRERGHELAPQDDPWGDLQVVTDDGREVRGAADPRGIGAVARGIVLEGANGSRILKSIPSE
ncbi:gamma-glutamyltransferase [Halofilum ochraceum]|uniref:gamma-glutamyltransferase n=1 Tax=Halofilum ochraceum TaxID=1611323 RepID=UPI0008DB23FC|nr:gamma-glutamyltransferase [Halofilum ochraceum]